MGKKINELSKIQIEKRTNVEELEVQYSAIDRAKLLVQQQIETLGRPVLARVETFGCQMNARDSEKILGILKAIGYEEAEDENADFVLYNTCTVRDNANQRVYGRLGALSSKKKKNPQMKIALCGCMMQEPSVIDKLKKSYRHVDLIFGTHNIFRFAELYCTMITSSDMIIDIWEETEEIVEDLPMDRKFSFKSGTNIMFGCNNFCSYCIVPYVRGRERSRLPEDIVKEITTLVTDGVVEIMLLGQNVNSYGKTLETKITFANLLQQIEQIEGLKRIRFMTSHPKDLSDELIEVMKNSKKICHHMHLPLQSGSTRILEKMNRHYTKEQYLEVVRKLKEAIPDIALTTDLIVGFPGETMEDIEETIDVIKKVGYDAAFTFIYSKRTGTPAANMDNQISEEDVKPMFDQVLNVVHETAKQRTSRYLGQTMELLVETINDHDDSLVTGKLSNNMTVHIKGTKELIGQFVQIKLTECMGFYYFGEIV